MTDAASDNVSFYRGWVLANGWAEGAGLGTTLSLGWLLAPHLSDVQGTVTILGGALVAVVMGILLEGVIVGWAQGGVLHRRLPALSLGSWVIATAVGAGIAWLLGMIPSTVMALRPTVPSAPPPAEPDAPVQYALAVALGLITGPMLGLAQWYVLRRHLERAGRWLWANAVAWAVGMPLIFLGMDRVPWSGPAAGVFVTIYGVCAVTGLAVGAIHGRFLLRLIEAPVPGGPTP